MEKVVFVDTEYDFRGIYLIGWANNLHRWGQLWGERLTTEQVEHTLWTAEYIFCWGPDIGRIEREFDIDMRNLQYAINLMSVVKEYMYLPSYRLVNVEEHIGIVRKFPQYKSDPYRLRWDFEDPTKRHMVLYYNFEDVMSLVRIWYYLRERYGVTLRDARHFAM